MSAAIVSVTGGVEGLAAHYGEIDALAGRFDNAAGTLTTLAERTASTLGDVHLLESAALAPVSFAEVEAGIALLATQTLATAAVWEGAGAGSRETVVLLRAADARSADTMHALDAVLADAVMADPVAGAALLLAFPPLTQHLVDGLPLRQVAALLGGRTESGVRVLRGPRSCARPPSSVTDLMTRLALVDDMPAGTIDVQTHVAADGTRTHVAYLPGTDDMVADGDSSVLRDLKENGRLIDDEPTAYGAGIAQALRLAGVRPGERVLLVGHSQGGMQAAQLLADSTSGADVTNVVTAGSPIAGAGHYPTGSHVLSLENVTDYVPELDGAANPDTPQQVTVRFADGPDTITGSHRLEHYVDGAAAVDASTDPSIRESLDSLQPFFADGSVTSQTFVLTRDVSGTQ